MFLKKIYTTPDYLFEPVTFVSGINYIFGKKENSNDKKESLNGIGKSTFLDLIDFALLCSFKKGYKKRLKAALAVGILNEYSVVLEFRIGDIDYIISRSFDKPSDILFSENGSKLSNIFIDNLKPYLCDLIFKQNSYEGIYSNKWLRQLIPFYVKIQPPSEKAVFVNPIRYIHEKNELALNKYHFFFLNISNELAYINQELIYKKNSLKNSLSSTKNVLSEYFKIVDSPQLQNKIRELESETDALSSIIQTFELNSKHEVDERKANKLTAQLSDLRTQKRNALQKIKFYEDSYKLAIDVKPNSIKKIYAEFNKLLAENIKKTLDDAISFKKKLIASRKDFISDEINKLKDYVYSLSEQIKQLDSIRTELFKILEAKEAISDLADAYYELSKKQEELNQLKSHNDILFKLEKESATIKTDLNDLYSKALDFKEKIKKQEFNFSQYLRDIYNSFYPEKEEQLFFDISTEEKKDAKFKFNVLTNNKMFSRGRNQGRTLIYDLSILFHAIDINIHMPRFLIHDGIFDGMDKSQFIKLVEYLDGQINKGKNFQYILSLNEEGTLEDKFGDADLVTPEKIENEAVLVLTQNKLLFKTKF